MRTSSFRLTSARRRFTRVAGLVALGVAVLTAQTGQVEARNEKYAGFVIDANTGKTLYEDRADALRYPASLTKMMTLYLTFEALEQKRISLDSQMPVSRYAAGRPPTKLGLRAGSTLKVEDAIYGLVTKSANDASVVLAEYLGGSVPKFAEAMTKRARLLGMTRTVFKNPHGLPDSRQHTTARDMSKLGIALREHFPSYYHYFSTRSYTYKGRRMPNHNRVLGRVEGTDGIKTGYINASGFNLVASVKRDGKNIVAVVFGGRSGRSRDNHMVDLISRTLPKASTRRAGPLVASLDTIEAVSSLPKAGPMPGDRPIIPLSISQRIAMAYDTGPASDIADSAAPVVGRDALRMAMRQERPGDSGLTLQAGSTPITSNAMQSVKKHRSGAIAAAEDMVKRSRSPWVVQIAAAPGESQAMEMLRKAAAAVGDPLGGAEPFTEEVASGSQTLYRARFAGFQDKDAAWNACAALKAAQYNCYAVSQ